MTLYPKYFRILWLGLSLVLCFTAGESHAQIRPIGGSSSGGFNPVGGNRRPGGFGQGGFGQGGFGQGSGAGGFTFANPDSTGGDSLQKPKIKPNTRLINRRELFIHLPFSERYRSSYERVHLWDEIEGRDGFTQSLGQVGKYYLRSYHGLNERFIDQPYYFDPIFGRYNPYMVNPEEQVIYFDTHTPYIRVNYVQGARELQITDVTLSQNITPLWNAVFYLKRRQSEGAYRNFVTDHYNLYMSGNYHTKNKRYYLFMNGTFNQLNDQYNGGVPRANLDGFYPTTAGGLIPDLLNADQRLLYNNSFFKQNRSTSLTDADGIKIARSFYVDHYFHLLGVSDSVEKNNKLSFRNQILFENGYQRFGDGGFDSAALAQNLIPVIPTLLAGGDSISESFITSQFKFVGEASYTIQNKKGYRLHLDGGIKYGRYTFRNDSINLEQNYTDQYVNGDIHMPWLKAEARLHQRFSDLFNVQRSLSVKGSIFPVANNKGYRKKGIGSISSEPDTSKMDLPKELLEKKKKEKYPDSPEPEKFKPLVLNVEYEVKDVNPTFFQKYYVGVQDNLFRGNPVVNNQQINHLSIGLDYNRPAQIVNKDTLLPNYYGVKAFLSRVGNLIYYSDSMEVRQAGDGQALTWIGVEARMRQNILKHFYLESSVAVQNGSADGDIPLQLYAESIPEFYGSASLYFERSNIKIAKRLRIGVELEYNNSFAGQTVDPISGEFFPTRYLVPDYPRVHAFFVLHPPRSNTYVWFRMQHLNEQFPYLGYYTTPFYPMLERTFSFGASWTFYD